MPLGPSQASPKLIPEEWPPSGFDIVYILYLRDLGELLLSVRAVNDTNK